jgi:hypothetical protein
MKILKQRQSGAAASLYKILEKQKPPNFHSINVRKKLNHLQRFLFSRILRQSLRELPRSCKYDRARPGLRQLLRSQRSDRLRSVPGVLGDDGVAGVIPRF